MAGLINNLQDFRQFLMTEYGSPFAILIPIGEAAKAPALNQNLLANGRQIILFSCVDSF